MMNGVGEVTKRLLIDLLWMSCPRCILVVSCIGPGFYNVLDGA